jgi:hypothetical protein
VLTIAALPAVAMELKANLFTIAPGVKYLPRLALTVRIEPPRATMRAFFYSLKGYLHYYFLLPSPDFLNLIIFKSE